MRWLICPRSTVRDSRPPGEPPAYDSTLAAAMKMHGTTNTQTFAWTFIRLLTRSRAILSTCFEIGFSRAPGLRTELLAVLVLCPAVVWADFQSASDSYERGNHTAAYQEFLELARSGYAIAQFNLGVLYDTGEGVPEDNAEAVKWYRLAAEQGLAEAQNNLGHMYAKGEGVPRDARKAVQQYRLAAEQGLADAQNNLGFMYAIGEGVTRDGTEAVKWYRQAAEQALAAAGHNLGKVYDNGLGVPEDNAEAAKWYRLAAEQGDPRSQFNLGHMYANGEGVEEDDQEAVRWYQLAAAQGYAAAQNGLGYMYFNGEGVPKDDTEAMRWYLLAAKQGDVAAQYGLGYLYANGIGVPQDFTQAYAWFDIAAEHGGESIVEVRDVVQKKMSAAQLVEARTLRHKIADEISVNDESPTTAGLGKPSPIRLASGSPDVLRQVQQQLQSLGYDPGPIDGVIGPRTIAAVKAFQRFAKVTPTGEISEELLELIQKATDSASN